MLFGLDNSHRVVSKYFFYNLAKLVLEQASKIRFWDLEKLRLELRKLKHKLIDAGSLSF